MTIRTCPYCNTGAPIHYSGGKSKGRCRPCYRHYAKNKIAAERRQRKLELLASSDDSSGRRVCSKCVTSKLLSEFSRRSNSRIGKLNKICDTCLTSIYNSDARRAEGFDESWWRRKAYGCNAAGRQELAKRRNVKVSTIQLSDLGYVCKPQDLINLFNKQGGECHYCTEPLVPDITSIDHATPLCRGGSHSLDNFRVACADCNHLKWKKTEEEFWEFLGRYLKRFKNHANLWQLVS